MWNLFNLCNVSYNDSINCYLNELVIMAINIPKEFVNLGESKNEIHILAIS